MLTKTIVSKRLPFYLVPLRSLYRKIASKLFTQVRLFQIEKESIKYLLWANEDIGKRMILQGHYEPGELRAFKKLIRTGDTCIDVGGNVGIFSLNFSKFCGSSGHVYVIEPMRKNQLVIELAAEINGFNNIAIFPYALSDSDGEVILEVPSVDGAYAFINPVVGKSEAEKITVRSLRLDQFLKEESIKRIDVLKIDVEGAEKLVLDGAKNILKDCNRQPRVVMVELLDEFLNRFGSNVTNVISDMQNYGYQPYYTTKNGVLVPFTSGDINTIFNVFFVQRDS